MPLLGHERRFGRARVAAASPPIATKSAQALNAVQGHELPRALQQNVSLFDHLVGQREQRGRDADAQRFGSSQIHDKLKFRRLLDGEIAGLRPTQYLVDIFGGAPKLIPIVWSVRYKPPASTFSLMPYIVGSRAVSASALMRIRSAFKSGSGATYMASARPLSAPAFGPRPWERSALVLTRSLGTSAWILAADRTAAPAVARSARARAFSRGFVQVFHRCRVAASPRKRPAVTRRPRWRRSTRRAPRPPAAEPGEPPAGRPRIMNKESASSAPVSEGVAIVGLAVRVPGANSVEGFWRTRAEASNRSRSSPTPSCGRRECRRTSWQIPVMCGRTAW